MKVKKGDTVQIMIGRDKGRKGKVTRVLPKEKKVIVEGVNEFKRHKKARMPQESSEIITISKPLPVSKVALIDTKTKKPTRVGYDISKKDKVRISKKSGQKI